jgi:hypothetical protein
MLASRIRRSNTSISLHRHRQRRQRLLSIAIAGRSTLRSSTGSSRITYHGSDSQTKHVVTVTSITWMLRYNGGRYAYLTVVMDHRPSTYSNSSSLKLSIVS